MSFLNNFIRNNKHWDYTEDQFNEEGVQIYDASYWENRVATWNTLADYNPEVIEVISNIVLRLKPVVERFFNVTCWPTKPAMVRWIPGTFQIPHADKELHLGEDAGKPNAFPWYDLAGLFYINDDYEGGEFMLCNEEIKLKQGDCIIFPSVFLYPHEVKPVTKGTRYSWVLWSW